MALAICIGLTGAVIVAAIGYMFRLSAYRHALDGGTVAPATVTSVKEEIETGAEGLESQRYVVTVLFSDSGGTTRSTTFERVFRKHSIDQRVEVIYDPNDTSYVRFADRCRTKADDACPSRYWGKMALASLLCIFFAGMTVSMIFDPSREFDDQWSSDHWGL